MNRPTLAEPSAATGSDVGSTGQRRSVRPQLLIFVAVNVALFLAWICLLLADVQIHGALWIWPVMMALWLARILLVDRRARHERAFSEEQIQEEIRRLR